MARKIWRYTLKTVEQKLWDREDMKGWCKALEGCVEDDAREQGLMKYVIYDRKGDVLAKADVSPLPEPKPSDFRRDGY